MQMNGNAFVHEAKPGGRWCTVVTYLEGGTTPIEARLLFRTAEDSQRFAAHVLLPTFSCPRCKWPEAPPCFCDPLLSSPCVCRVAGAEQNETSWQDVFEAAREVVRSHEFDRLHAKLGDRIEELRKAIDALIEDRRPAHDSTRREQRSVDSLGPLPLDDCQACLGRGSFEAESQSIPGVMGRSRCRACNGTGKHPHPEPALR